jgi:hypothetical protein
MKKMIFLFMGVIIGMGVLLVLPKQKVFTERVLVKCTPTAATRVMSDIHNWKGWWPGEITNDTNVSFRNNAIKIQTLLLNGFYANTTVSNLPAFIDLQFLSAPEKQADFNFSATIYFSSNPFVKLIQYFRYNKAKAELLSLLTDIKTNLEDVKKVYGFEITEERVPNAIHISTKKEFNRIPTTEDIYSAVDELNQYIQSNKAKAVNTPIYNVFTLDDIHYQLMVAIATDKPLPTNDKYSFKEMVRGKIIIGKAIGSSTAVAQCLKQVEYFVKDYGRSSPAIQFNRLITDRRKEIDSTKWITTVNYPVFDRSFF